MLVGVVCGGGGSGGGIGMVKDKFDGGCVGNKNWSIKMTFASIRRVLVVVVVVMVVSRRFSRDCSVDRWWVIRG